MNNKNNFIPRHGSPLFYPQDPSEGFQGGPGGLSRRKFLKRTGGATASVAIGSVLTSKLAAHTTWVDEAGNHSAYQIRAVENHNVEDSETGPQPLVVNINGNDMTFSTKIVRRVTLNPSKSDWSSSSATSIVSMTIESVVFYSETGVWKECFDGAEAPFYGAEIYTAKFPAGAPSDTREIASVTKSINSDGEVTGTTVQILGQTPGDQGYDNTYAPAGFSVAVNYEVDQEENIDEVKVTHSGGGPGGNTTPIEVQFEIKKEG